MRCQLAIAAIGLLFAAAPALALDLPTRKAGLWELKMIFEGRNLPPTVMKHCTDAATDRLMNANFGNSNEQHCSKQDMKTSGGTITIDSVCKFGDMTTTSHAVVTGSFDSAYTMKVASTRQGGPSLPGSVPGAETHMTIEAKHLGSCEAGQRPGDVIMSNGMKMNVLDMPKMGGAPPKRP
ncbi:MAG: DUF3617 family protein [Rhizobiales bacterium]|nr:DUF3617 family protein [Hyphomicrobiales bacterium]